MRHSTPRERSSKARDPVPVGATLLTLVSASSILVGATLILVGAKLILVGAKLILVGAKPTIVGAKLIIVGARESDDCRCESFSRLSVRLL